MRKLPIPTYRSDDFMGNTHVCGIKDVEKLVFALWITRATICKYFDFEKYFDSHPESQCRMIPMIAKMITAKNKCLRVAQIYGDVDIEKF